MRRLGIYFLYDKDGIVDNYVSYFLEHLKPFCEELCVVINGKLCFEGRRKLERCTDKIIVRENVGFDSSAYKAAMESYGYKKISEYDELILCNFTCYGPVYPFKELFEKMDSQKDLDFWGISRYPKQDFKVCGYDVPEHIMSFFIGIRKKMTSSNDFKSYWDNLKVAHNYEEAVAFNELIFTTYFTDHGFKSDTFVPYEVDAQFKENSPTFSPISIIKCRCPIVKRRAFFSDYGLFLHFGRGDQPRDILDYIKENTEYDVNLIWENLIRTQKGSTLKRNLHLNYFLDEQHYIGDESKLKKQQKVAMLCYCYYADMLDYCCDWAKNLPEWADIYVIVVNDQSLQNAKKIFAKLPNKVEVRIKENRGQLASAVLISGKDIFDKYDLVCVTQAKKTLQLGDQFSSENFCNHCWEGVLKSSAYVLNLIQSYNDNPRMGYTCNFVPNWDHFTGLIGCETTVNRQNMKKLYQDFKLHIPFDDEPIASYGECYWVRSKGYKNLLSYKWKHDDFPEAKNSPKDGSILNALERMLPLFVQDEGFYPAWSIPKSYASVYFDNIYFKYRQLLPKPILKNKVDETITAESCHNKIKEDHSKSKSQQYEITQESFFKLFNEISQISKFKRKYLINKVLSYVTFGNSHKRHVSKAKNFKKRFKDIKLLIDGNK